MTDHPYLPLDVLDQKSPLEKWDDLFFSEVDLDVWIKRDDQLLLPDETSFPAFCGNKWRKLKYNLREARQLGFDRLLTFGGAYSNHIAAVAAAGPLFGFRTIGVIRGEPHYPLNPTLAFAKEQGMSLVYLDRSAFRQKTEPAIIENLLHEYGPAFILPEGGTNERALQGCEELCLELEHQMPAPPDYICVSAGTGGTAAGIIRSCAPPTRVLVFPALKGDFLRAEIDRWLLPNRFNWTVISDYHFGGYARWKPELLTFMDTFTETTGVTLDPVYTGKLAYGIWEEARKGHFPAGSRIVMIHTGGLQGRLGFAQRFGLS